MKWILAIAMALSAQEQKFAELKNFKLTSGEAVASVKLGYRTSGTLNAAKSNAILFPTWFGGKSENLQQFVGKDKVLDPDRFFVILVDALSNGVSTRIDNVTIRDMVRSQHRLLTEHLGIARLHGVIGISMGGMQSFEWAVAYPGFADRIVPIIGSPKLSTPDLLLWQAQLSAIEAAVANKIDPRAVMPAVNAMQQFALRTPEYDAVNGAEWTKLKQSLANPGNDPLDRAAQLRAMMSQNLNLQESVAKVRAKMLIVYAAQDHMVNPKTSIEFANLGGFAALNLNGNCGHMATSCESARMTATVRAFLEQ